MNDDEIKTDMKNPRPEDGKSTISPTSETIPKTKLSTTADKKNPNQRK